MVAVPMLGVTLSLLGVEVTLAIGAAGVVIRLLTTKEGGVRVKTGEKKSWIASSSSLSRLTSSSSSSSMTMTSGE